MSRLLILAIMLYGSFKCYGDNGPKFYEKVLIEFSHNENNDLFDSVFILVKNRNYSDTAFLPPHSTAQYWTRPTLSKYDDHYKLFSHGSIESFKIVAFKGNDIIESDFLKRYPGNSFYVIEKLEKTTSGNRKEIVLVDNSPLFHQYWKDYLIALVLTIIIELVLGVIFYFKSKRARSLRSFLISLILINVLTHFSLWLVYSHFYISLFVLEICVVMIESMFWKSYMRFSIKKAILVSLILNLASWSIGGIIAYLV